MGRDLMRASDMVVRTIDGYERPTEHSFRNVPVIGSVTSRFTADPEGGRRYEDNFRDGLEGALAEVNSASEHLKTTPRSEMTVRERRALGAKNAIQKLQTKELRAITTLRKEIRDIAGDRRMDGERKRRLIDMREAKIRRISQAGLAKLDRILNR